MIKRLLLALSFGLVCTTAVAHRHTISPHNPSQYLLGWNNRFYAGILVGYGDTNWGRLVSKDQISSFNTPLSGGGDGTSMGINVGYFLMKYLSVELEYVHYPSARVILNKNANGYNPIYGFTTDFESHTEYFAGLAKIYVPIYDTGVSAFSDLGVAYTWRHDVLAKKGNVRPTFGIGFTYLWGRHILATAQFQFTPGTGESAVTPVLDYIPYLYTGQVGLAYLF